MVLNSMLISFHSPYSTCIVADNSKAGNVLSSLCVGERWESSNGIILPNFGEWNKLMLNTIYFIACMYI
jgi:hypothetical protein